MAQLRYPSNIASSNSTYITFTRMKNRGFKTNELKRIDQVQFTAQPTDIIALPIPNEFSDVSGIDYTNIQDTSLLGSGTTSIINNFSGAGQIAQEARKKTAVSNATQQMLLFDGVRLKIWSFSWNLIPESKTEASAIENIIKNFELAKLPSYTLGAEALSFPDLFRIRFGGVKPKLIKFLPSVITDITVTYGSENFQVYETGDFPEIQLNVTMGELVARTWDVQNSLYNFQ